MRDEHTQKPLTDYFTVFLSFSPNHSCYICWRTFSTRNFLGPMSVDTLVLPKQTNKHFYLFIVVHAIDCPCKLLRYLSPLLTTSLQELVLTVLSTQRSRVGLLNRGPSILLSGRWYSLSFWCLCPRLRSFICLHRLLRTSTREDQWDKKSHLILRSRNRLLLQHVPP